MSETLPSTRRFRADPRGWQALFAAIDQRDAAGFAAFLTPDAEFRFGNAPPVRGRPAITSAVAGFFGMIVSCRHRADALWQDASSAVSEGQVCYVVPGGAEIVLPFVNVLELAAEGISRYRIYIDNGPLLAAVA